MKFLIDTNVFIPLEPTSPSEQEVLTSTAVDLARASIQNSHQLYVHPAAKADIDRDVNTARASLRRTLFDKYPLLPDPPPIPSHWDQSIGIPLPHSNDWVDHQLLATIVADAVDFLVTEDRKLRKKARRIGYGNRVLSVVEALTLILDLAEQAPTPPPAVDSMKAHAIDATDPIFNTFREDYPSFDKWFRKCRSEHRQTWSIRGNGSLAGFCLINREKDPPPPLTGKILKLCSFKISERFNGFRFGELLLKAVFDHAFQNRYDWIFVTVFEKHHKLIELLEDFGFEELGIRTDSGELVLAKPVKCDVQSITIEDPLRLHIRHGPYFFMQEGVPWYIVPIQPRYSRLLFPESSPQPLLFKELYPSGNALRKAYLCNSLTRTIRPGSILAFYRSRSDQGLIAIGIAEEALVTDSSEEIVKAVGKRTVYGLADIQKMCRRPVLAILFRQARILKQPVPMDRLVQAGVFQRAPQSIMKVGGEGLEWLKTQIPRQ